MKNKKKVIASLLLLNAMGIGLASCNNETSSSSSDASASVTEEEKHSIEAVSNKDVEISADVNQAKEGDTVTINVKVLNEDKVLDRVLVNGSSNGVNEVTKGSKYTFVMGKEDIKITASLSDKVYQAHSITINQVEGFSISFKVGSGEESQTASAKKGDLVTVLIDVTSDTHRFKELTSNDVTLSLSKNEGTHVEETFVMVDKEVSLVLVDEEIPTHSLGVISNTGITAKFFYKDQEVTRGIEGKEIRVKLTLQEKYVFKTISMVNEGVELKTIKEGEEYSFIMPNEDVRVAATCNKVVDKYTFVDIQTCGGVTITSNIVEGGKAEEGSEVKIAFSYKNKKDAADSNYTVSYGAYINNDLVMATLNESAQTGEISFTMPSKDVTIYVGPFNEPLADATDNTSEVILPEINDNYKIFGVKNGFYEQGNYRSMALYILAKKQFVVSRFTYSKGERDIALSIYSGHYSFYFSYVSAGASTTLKVEGSLKELRSITFTDIDKIDIEGDYSSTVEGKQVSLKIKPKAGYGLNNKSYPNYIVKNYQRGDKTNTGVSWSWNDYSNTLSFTMPDADLTITLNIVEQVSLVVSNPEVLSSYKFTESIWSDTAITSINGGSTVYFWPVAKEGQRITGIYLNDSTTPLTLASGKSYYQFAAPESGTASLRIETVTLHSFVAESTDAYEVSSISSTSNAKGDNVSFKLVRKTGYKIEKVALSNGTELTTDTGSVDTYSFTMPDEDVTLLVTTEAVTTVSFSFASVEPFLSYDVTDIYGRKVKDGEKLNSGEQYDITFIVKNGYNVSNLTASDGTITKIDDTKYRLLAPDTDLTITPEFAESEKHTITIANEDTDHYGITSILDDNNSIKDNETFNGYVGHTIKIRIDSKDNSSKIRYFANAKVVNASTNEEVTSKITTQNDDTLSLSFTMPAFDVKVEFDIEEKQTHQVIKGENADLFIVRDGKYSGNVVNSYVKGAKLYVALNLDSYQKAFYSSFVMEYTYVLNGETKVEEYTFESTYSTLTIDAPDADITFNLKVTEPTEKVTITKEKNDQADKFILTNNPSYGDGFGDSFEFAKGKTLYAKITADYTYFGTGKKFIITIKNTTTGETIDTFETTSINERSVEFTTTCDITVTLTYVTGN